MVGTTGIEPVTPSMSTRCSPAELRALKGPGFSPFQASLASRPVKQTAAAADLAKNQRDCPQNGAAKSLRLTAAAVNT